ncbi:TPA: four helix bundle protein, partial [Legionella pneumophila]|nr:four helix bundle protein [Legionella pneumophila]HAT1764548.1 four helix bundle protein [Legionella pneumophila]HAT1816618.1 four helix bundle protein [Legionella pneumophila]
LCVEMKLISLKRQAQLSELLTRIGKQVTGWRNASRKPES